MKNLLLPAFLLAGALGVRADILTAPNATFNWTNENAWNAGTATWNSATPDSAILGDISSGRTAQLSNAITAQDISVTNTNNTWTISGTGGAITLNGTLTKSGTGTLLIQTSVPLGGDGAVVIDDGEVQLINNTNTFSGGITLNAGTLRIGNANGAGDGQTAGSLGTGTLTLNGGRIHQNQSNTRNQYVNAIIGGNFQLTSITNTNGEGGGLQIGSPTGARSVDLGAAPRTITVSVNVDGTGAASFLGLLNLTNSFGAAIVKAGAGVLRISGTNLTAPVSVGNGSLEVVGGIGGVAYAMAPGTVWRKTTATGMGDGATITMTNASLVSKDTLANNRGSVFQSLQVSGTNSVFLGSGVTLQASGTHVSGFNIRTNGLLGGNGLVRTAATDTVSNGVTVLSDFSDAAITLGVTGANANAVGSIRPGDPGLLDLSIGTLAFGSLTWNAAAGSGTAAPQMYFNLGSTNASDRVVLSGAFAKGGGTNFIFDFVGNAAVGTFTLVEFASTDFAVEDFTYTNLASGFSGTFATNATSLQFVVTSSGSPYNNWLTNYPSLTGTNALPAADPDGDGFDNFKEFAFDGNPTVGSPALLTTSRSGTNATFNFVARLDALANYVVMSTTNLATGPWVTNSVTVTNSADQSGVLLTNDYVRRAFTVPATGNEFFRVKAELVP